MNKERLMDWIKGELVTALVNLDEDDIDSSLRFARDKLIEFALYIDEVLEVKNDHDND